MYNITNGAYNNAYTNWYDRSIILLITPSYEPPLLFSIILGGVLIMHSWYLHGFKYNQTRKLSELCSLSMIGASACLLSCINDKCDLSTRTIVYNIMAESVLIPITMVCDTYLTYKRYNVIVKTTKLYKTCVFAYWVICMVLPWYPFYNILPIWYDQNSYYWVTIRYNTIYISTFSIIFYYITYFILVYLELKKLNANSDSIRELTLIEFSLRSLGHAIFSITAIIVALLTFPEGTLYIYIIDSIGIHVFLNWDFDIDWLLDLVNKRNRISIISFLFKRKITPGETAMVTNTYVIIDIPLNIVREALNNNSQSESNQEIPENNVELRPLTPRSSPRLT